MPNVSSPLRILVVGQTPPPVGGQAVMIKKLLDGEYEHVRLYHVRLAFSADMHEVGVFKPRKLWVLLRTIIAIAVARVRHRTPVLYYPPSGPNLVPVLRDIALLNAVRWMFRYTVFHYHAGGVSTFSRRVPFYLRPLFHSAYGQHDLAIRLATMAPEDGKYFKAKDDVVVINGIEDDAGGFIERPVREGEPVRLLFTAVLIPSKGVEVLLEAFAIMRRKGLNVDLRLMGKWASPEFESKCLAFIAREGLTDHVHVLGLRMGEEKANDFRGTDIFCFPSHFEAEVNPVVLLEALEYGIPVVTTRWRGIPMIVADRVNGLLVEPKDPQAVADAVEKLVLDPGLRRELGMAGRRIFEERYTLERHRRNMEQAFLRLLDPPKEPCRVLVVGQTPPPVGGQAVMIAQLLEGRYSRVRLFHVRMAFSRDMGSVGKFAPHKVLTLFSTIILIVWARFRHGASVLYYPPSGPNMVPVLRDIALLCSIRWLFRRTVFHFHACGVSGFTQRVPSLLRPMFRMAYHRPDLAIRTAVQNPDDGAGFDAVRNVVVPCGVPDMRGTVPERVAAPGEPVVILFTGLLIPSKGPRVLLEAFHAVVSRGLDARLELMGEWGGPEFERECRDYVADKGLEGRVSFLGPLHGREKWECFAACDIFCFPSYFESESFGLVVVEAMQFAKPVVVTDWRGIPASVDEGVNGFLVPVRDVLATADRLALLAGDAALRSRMGQEGRRIFEQRSTLDAFYGSMEKELANLCG